jgi:hypothetical protein
MPVPIAAQLPHRLERYPSPMADARSAAIYAAVPVFMTVISWLGDARLPLIILGVVSVGLLANVARKLRRASSGRIPIVEVDAQPWKPGQAGQVRVFDPDVASLDGVEVVLVADAVNIRKLPQGQGDGWQISPVLRHYVPLLSVKTAECQAFIDRTIPVTVPREAADQDWHWRIVVLGQKAKVRVPVREDSFPVRIV